MDKKLGYLTVDKYLRSNQFNFLTIPKMLLTDDMFKHLSYGSKILYSFLLEYMNEKSKENNWIDEKDRIYIICPIDEMKKILNCDENKVIEIFNELQTEGLVEEKPQGIGKPSIIYVHKYN